VGQYESGLMVWKVLYLSYRITKGQSSGKGNSHLDYEQDYSFIT